MDHVDATLCDLLKDVMTKRGINHFKVGLCDDEKTWEAGFIHAESGRWYHHTGATLEEALARLKKNLS